MEKVSTQSPFYYFDKLTKADKILLMAEFCPEEVKRNPKTVISEVLKNGDRVIRVEEFDRNRVVLNFKSDFAVVGTDCMHNVASDEFITNQKLQLEYLKFMIRRFGEEFADKFLADRIKSTETKANALYENFYEFVKELNNSFADNVQVYNTTFSNMSAKSVTIKNEMIESMKMLVADVLKEVRGDTIR